MEDIGIVEKNQDNVQLQKIANHLYKQYFHHKLHCKVIFDKTLDADNLLGEFFYYWYFDDTSRIFINPFNAKEFNNGSALDTIKHELIHYYLFKIKDKNGFGHTKHFYRIARKIGVHDTPWSLKFPLCRKAFKENYYKPVYFYYSYKIGVYWEWYRLYTGSHITDKYDKKRFVHYLGFLPTYSLFPVIHHLRNIVHDNLNLTTPRILNKLNKYMDKLRYGKYQKYIDSFFSKENKQSRKQASQRAKVYQFSNNFAKAINHKNKSKTYIILDNLYKKYFHHTLNCNIYICADIQSPKFIINHHSAYIKIGCIGPYSYNCGEDYDTNDAENDLPHIKLCLLHYYLWSIHDSQGYKHSKKFYKLAKKKFGMVLKSQDKLAYVIQNPRKDFRNIYYSYNIGLFWSSNFIDGYAYINNKPRKIYYLVGVGTCLYPKWIKSLHQEIKKDKKLHLKTATIVKYLRQDCKKLDCKYNGRNLLDNE